MTNEPEQDSYPTAAEQFAQRLVQLQKMRGDVSVRDLEELTDLIAQEREREARRLGLSLDDGDVLEIKGVSKSVIARLRKGKTGPSMRAANLLDEALQARGTLEILGSPARGEPFLHLPTGPSHFVGRGQDQLQLTTLAEARPASDAAPAVLVLEGPPGVGKTALALRWANSMQRLFDVVLYASLAGYAPGFPTRHTEILAEILRGLGVEDARMPTSAGSREALVRDQLQRRGQRVLVVLDNARDSHQVQPLLPHLPGATVLVTSRSQMSGLVLDNGAQTMRLDMMEDADAVELATAIIEDERATLEPDAVAQLVDLCGSLPLAVIVAAERVAVDPDTSIAQHAEALAARGRRLQLLDIDEDDTTIGVRAAFSWSYATLPPAVARMFRLLSAHPGAQFSVRAAAALAGVSPAEGALLVDQLWQAHLVEQVRGNYYRFHDLLREYAAAEAANLPERERRDGVQRLVLWFLHSVNASSWALTPMRDHHVRLPAPPPLLTPQEFTNFDQALSWCTRELPNVLPIARLGMDSEMFYEVWRLCVDLFDFLYSRPADVWISCFQIAVDAANASSDNVRIAEAHEKLAAGHRRRGEVDQAHQLAVRAVELCADRGPSRTLGFAMLGLGHDAHIDGNHGEALTLTGQAVDIFVAAGSWVGEATARMALGSVCRALGEKDPALEHGERALALFTAAHDSHGTAVALLPLARTSLRFGDAEHALRCCDESYDIFRATGDIGGQADAVGAKGLVLAELGDQTAAITCLREALRLVEGRDERKAAMLLADLATVEQT